ncbi:MAG: GH32 C-terminal domain-containing protein, partial [Anaerolineales bacterium]
DPKVFWDAADGQPGHWVMVLAAGAAILFYTSPDLKHWSLSGRFGDGYGATGGVWETPDLFLLAVDDGPGRQWVLTGGVGGGGPAGGTGMQYFVGVFDGQTFTSANLKETVLWADYGADFYAAQSWSEAPGGRRLWIGWMSNGRYATLTPTETWRSAMSLPRELSLATTTAGVRLLQKPASELRILRGEGRAWADQIVTPEIGLPLDFAGEVFELLAEVEVPAGASAQRVGLRLASSGGPPTSAGYDLQTRTVFVERGVCGDPPFSVDFAGRQAAAVEARAGLVTLQIFVDRSSVEIFANDGETVITALNFTCPGQQTAEWFADGGAVTVKSLIVYPLQAAEFAAVGQP